jgi:hypothetical protein
MTAETEPANDILIVNEMRVVGPKGSRHYVLVQIDGQEVWMVDGHEVTVTRNAVVGFFNMTNVDHFVSQKRAIYLGLFADMAALELAYRASVEPEPQAEPVHDKPRRGRKPKDHAEAPADLVAKEDN